MMVRYWWNWHIKCNRIFYRDNNLQIPILKSWTPHQSLNQNTMTIDKDKLLKQCEYVAETVRDLWHNVFYVWLYGSQNYNLETETSDMDFKALIIPELEDLVENSKPVSYMIDFPWWQVEIKDIRNYIDSAVKVNINFLEILKTEFFWADDYYKAEEMRKFFVPLLEKQWCQYLRATMGMMIQKYEALRHPYPSKKEIIEKFWYDPKQLCHLTRLSWEIENYYSWRIPTFSYKWDDRKVLIDLKKWVMKNEFVDEYVRRIMDSSRTQIDSYIWSHNDDFSTKQEMISCSRNLITNYIIKWLEKR